RSDTQLVLGAVGREMVGRFESGPEFLCGDESAQRHPAADRFCEAYDVRLDAVVMVAEGFSGASEAAEYFILNERDIVAAADILHFWPVLVRRNDDTANSKDRLADHDRRFARNAREKHGLDLVGAFHAAARRLQTERAPVAIGRGRMDH